MKITEYCASRLGSSQHSATPAFRFLLGVTCLWLVMAAGIVQAAEPYLQFIQGLRARQYHDTALLYLQSLEQRSDVPADIKAIIPYEKALTLVEGSQFVQNPDAQGKQLDQAQAFLEKFLKDSPNHPLAPTANTELARIMLGKAQVLTWKSRSPSNADNRAKFQQDARALVKQARAIFQKAHDGYKKEWESYGVYIPEEETEKRAARAKVEGLYMRSQLDLATCTYEEAQTFDKGSKEFKALLQKASLEFEDLHSKYRSQYAGLFARIMQGKCFEEQDDIRKALGIYDELLSHPGESEGLKKLQNQVRHFRMICLNHDSRKDYQLIIIEAGDWLRLNRAYSRTPTGLGIRWELAVAQEKLALERTTQEADRVRLLRQALENAREINKYAGPYKDVSNAMVQRVLVALDREPGDPKDFDTAFGMANSMLEQIGELRNKLKAAEKAKNKEEITKTQDELQAMLSETERLYRLALSLTLPETPASQINAARYRLAYMFYQQRKSYETAVLGEYLSVRARVSEPAVALDGAYLAMAGYSQAFNDAPEAAKDDVLHLMVQVCEYIATNWPDSDGATDARMEMGRIYRRNKQPVEAAKWFAQVPKTTAQYASAQLEAGQAYWNAYLTAAAGEQGEGEASNEELKTWQEEAAKFLQNGITKMQEGLPAAAATPQELTRAKVSLSQIEIMRGNEKKAVELLTVDPHSVVKAITPAEGQPRPKTESDVKSTTFASFAYQQLLRAYIGTRQLDKAEEARASLEKVAGESGGEALTAVYVELGRELQNELERLKKQGDQKRLEEVRSGFESFLNTLFERKNGQTYGSLIWIAETYFGLAEGSEENPQKEKQYYTAAAKTYEEIIKRGSNNSAFIDPSRLIGVKLRLVNCKAQEGDFATAESLAKDVLKESPRALDAQIEAANLYYAWGLQGEQEHFLDAVRGKTFEDGTVIWGWANIAKRLQMLIDSGQATPEYQERNRESRYRLAESRVKFAEKSTDLKASEEQLNRAKFELLAFTSITPGLPETSWWPKYDEIYQQIQQNLGEAVMPLTKPELTLTENSNVASSYDSGEANAAMEAPVETAAPPAKAKAEPADNTLTFILMGVMILGGLGVAGYMVLGAGKASKKRSSTADLLASSQKPVDFAAVASGAPPVVKKRPRPASPTATPAGEKPAPEKTGERPVRTRPREPGSEQRRPERPPEHKRTEQRRPATGNPTPDAERKRVRRKPPEQS